MDWVNQKTSVSIILVSSDGLRDSIDWLFFAHLQC